MEQVAFLGKGMRDMAKFAWTGAAFGLQRRLKLGRFLSEREVLLHVWAEVRGSCPESVTQKDYFGRRSVED